MKKMIALCGLCLGLSLGTGAQIRQSTLLTFLPEQYGKVELDIEVKQSYRNPYAQEDIALDMLVTAPSGKELRLPCYFEKAGQGKLSYWKAHFTPQEAGTYTYAFVLSKAGKETDRSQGQTFRAAASEGRGFLHTKSDWVLMFDNGEPFRGVGENICWESRDHDDSKYYKALHELGGRYNYDYLLENLAKSGGDFFRTWMCGWNLPIDYRGPFNNQRYVESDEYYNPSALQRMDYLVELSESLGLYMMLTLGQGGFTPDHRGVASDSDEFFGKPEARAWYKNRLRYIVARWGYSPAIAMWEFFNEVDNVQHRHKGGPIDGRKITDWHAEMSAYLKQIDPYEHIVTTSISHRDVEGLNSVEDIDINQKHIYNRTDAIPEEINRYVRQYGKPYIIGEFGREWDWSKNFDDFSDEMDIDFRRGIWYGVFSPTPVLPLSWWWEYFDARGMTAYYRGVRDICDRMLAAGRGSFEPLEVKAGHSQAFAVRCGEEIYVYVFNPQKGIAVSDIEVAGGDGRNYVFERYHPFSRQYSESLNVQEKEGRLVLEDEVLGSACEMLYILKPLS
ncbi:MAG: DUF5060 domain-containing protein [Candidatus Bacteroides intestinipullorum]|uniref:mannan endo-1,4-beta-mannosidase n=1 Tax=Candidatus Bacteroides intestinipullorum TaxID=2838471 RepID=A0A9E2NP23_9BACE|nr:DUF5060 domain-containing protein [Candidatus Bacteroides intestinipullorum]